MSPRSIEADGRRLLLLVPARVWWPDEGITKGDVVDYYLDVADHLLPCLAGRPLSLLHCPEGAPGSCVYQKTAPPGLPPWVMTRRLPGDPGAAAGEYVVGADRATLAYLVNLAYLSWHPWNCTAEASDRPDQLVLDLDPTDVAFREVRNAARLLRDLLEGFGIRAWVKTSGGRGLHILVPLQPLYTFEEVRAAADALTRLARAREPKLFTLETRRARRRGRILIDVHRNRRGATLVSAYSVRELPGAPVSTPLEWRELERPVYPADFHLRNLRERLDEVGDPLADFHASPQVLTELLERARARHRSRD